MTTVERENMSNVVGKLEKLTVRAWYPVSRGRGEGGLVNERQNELVINELGHLTRALL